MKLSNPSFPSFPVPPCLKGNSGQVLIRTVEGAGALERQRKMNGHQENVSVYISGGKEMRLPKEARSQPGVVARWLELWIWRLGGMEKIP